MSATLAGEPASTMSLDMKPLPETLVVSLHEDVGRREHITRHFHEIGIGRFGFWPAVRHDDEQVRAAYRGGMVHAWPPCFRCLKPRCECPNNILIPQQVANWLSFLSLWRSLPDDPGRYFLVCEDDVAFHQQATDVLRGFLHRFVPEKRHVLIRLANSGEEPFRRLPREDVSVTQRVVMSNAAYVLNGSMANWLARSFRVIETTSDIWVHRTCASAPEVQSLTLDPLLATDLSFSKLHARFPSRIHPKGIDAVDVARQNSHVKRVDDVAQYDALLADWTRSST